MRAQFVFHEVWIGLRRNLTMTIALVVVVAISLSLLGTGLLFVKQVDNTRTYWQGRVQLSIYLCTRSSVSPQCEQRYSRTPLGSVRRNSRPRCPSRPQMNILSAHFTLPSRSWLLVPPQAPSCGPRTSPRARKSSQRRG